MYIIHTTDLHEVAHYQYMYKHIGNVLPCMTDIPCPRNIVACHQYVYTCIANPN